MGEFRDFPHVLVFLVFILGELISFAFCLCRSTGGCLEYLLKNGTSLGYICSQQTNSHSPFHPDVLGTLVRLSETDRPPGIQKEVLRAVSNMVVMLDEQFLVHSAVHRAVLRLLRNCVGDDLQEQLDGRARRPMGAAGNVVRTQPSEHEKDRTCIYYCCLMEILMFCAVVNLLCILCSRIRTYRELLMIFFHDKHWYRSEPVFEMDEDEGDDEDEENEEDEDEESKEDEESEDDPDSTIKINNLNDTARGVSPSPSHVTITSTQQNPSIPQKKPEYEFLLFNYLLRFVHREGEIGEFARAGLLFLMDVAMSPNESGNQPPANTNPTDRTAAVDPVNDAALALAEYILDGDFSDVLGAGLSAVYSLLPSKLAFYPQIPSENLDNAMKIGASSMDGDDILALRQKYQSMGMEDAKSPEFTAKIDHFLTLLVFIQDALRRNKPIDGVDASALVGTAIVQNILDAVRRVFLENVLYPSILECSDADGSAVAVMSYIEIVVRTLRDGPLANLFVDFLVSEDNEDTRLRQRVKSMVTLGENGTTGFEKGMKHRRRQSSAMTLLEMEAPGSRKPTDYFTSMGRFTLKDLLISNLKSQYQTTATIALQLLQTMLIYHPQVAVERILLVISDPHATSFPHPALLSSFATEIQTPTIPEEDEDEDEEFRYPGAEDSLDLSFAAHESLFPQPETTYATHERETALYLALVSRVDPLHDNDRNSFSTSYDRYLHDAVLTIQGQPVYWRALGELGEVKPRFKHRLNVHDPILSILLESLITFFSNTPDFNVGLTGILATLAMHPDRSLAGWLTVAIPEDTAPSKSQLLEEEIAGDGDDRSIDFIIEEKLANGTNSLPAASIDEKSRPVLYTIYHGLVTQLERYRQSVEQFDKFLLERRQGLVFSENLTDALSLGLDLKEEPKPIKLVPESVSKPKPTPKQSTSSSFVSFLTPKKSKSTKPVPVTEPTTPPRNTLSKSVTASPFGTHYQRTGSLKVEPFVAPIPPSGPWTPSSKRRNFTIAEEDVFGSAWGQPQYRDSPEEDKKLLPVTLSQLLDNIVILEESIKELVAIIHARRSLGIDSLRYV